MTHKLKTSRKHSESLGIKTYEGKPCPACDNTIRYVLNRGCKFCQSQESRRRSRERVEVLRLMQGWCKVYSHEVERDVVLRIINEKLNSIFK